MGCWKLSCEIAQRDGAARAAVHATMPQPHVQSALLRARVAHRKVLRVLLLRAHPRRRYQLRSEGLGPSTQLSSFSSIENAMRDHYQSPVLQQ
jgi:hypothetical protein